MHITSNLPPALKSKPDRFELISPYRSLGLWGGAIALSSGISASQRHLTIPAVSAAAQPALGKLNGEACRS